MSDNKILKEFKCIIVMQLAVKASSEEIAEDICHDLTWMFEETLDSSPDEDKIDMISIDVNVIDD